MDASRSASSIAPASESRATCREHLLEHSVAELETCLRLRACRPVGVAAPGSGPDAVADGHRGAEPPRRGFGVAGREPERGQILDRRRQRFGRIELAQPPNALGEVLGRAAEIPQIHEGGSEVCVHVREAVWGLERLGVNEALLEERQRARRIVLDQMDECEVVERRGNRVRARRARARAPAPASWALRAAV